MAHLFVICVLSIEYSSYVYVYTFWMLFSFKWLATLIICTIMERNNTHTHTDTDRSDDEQINEKSLTFWWIQNQQPSHTRTHSIWLCWCDSLLKKKKTKCAKVIQLSLMLNARALWNWWPPTESNDQFVCTIPLLHLNYDMTKLASASRNKTIKLHFIISVFLLLQQSIQSSSLLTLLTTVLRISFESDYVQVRKCIVCTLHNYKFNRKTQ